MAPEKKRLPARRKIVQVNTRAPENRTVAFQCRVPRNYDAARKSSYRILVIFGGRNTDGKADASGQLGWGKWADDNGVFIIAPGFKNDSYWEPKDWSGKALFDAIALLKAQYNVCDKKLLYYGYSAGSQASNLFPAWRPDVVRAWVSHACGVFYEPSVRMRGVPGLVTCGDADAVRYIISRRFVDKNRKFDVSIIWKSLPNSPHDVPPDSLRLARAFLTYYHLRYIDDLNSMTLPRRFEKEKIAFVGDDQENTYYPADSPKAKNIPVEDRVDFPSPEIAEAWGRAAL